MKLLFAEDEVSMAEAVTDILTYHNYTVDTVYDGADALDYARAEQYDGIILDIMMPKKSGYDICREIREQIDIPILMVTAKTESVDKIRGLGLGADDYIVKPFDPMELVARVKSQLRRYTTLSSTPSGDAVYEAGGLVINDELKKVTVDGEEVKLTPIEYNILLLLMKNKGKVFSISQIYEEIWNEEAIGADNTVAVHIRHIREKIEINPKEPRYLKVVWGVGYKIEAGA